MIPSTESDDDGDVLWRPSADLRARSGLARYLHFTSERRGIRHTSYRSLWRWSVDDLAAFWSSIWEFESIAASAPPSTVLAAPRMPGAEWFPGARLNYAEHLLRRFADRPEAEALVVVPEAEPPQVVTAGRLRREAGSLAAALRRLGVQPGDRVAAYLPNTAHAVVGLIACASMGAIWSICSPDLGSGAVVRRFRQLAPRVLLFADGYRHGGRVHPRHTDVAGIVAGLPSLRHVIEVRVAGDAGAPPRGHPPLPGAVACHDWDELTSGDEPLTFAQVPFDHPLWVLFSSGTTGVPKGIVHGHGGILLEHCKALRLHNDLRAGDRFLLVANTSWMVWNLLVSGLLLGATPVLLDGSPTHPALGRIWEIAAAQRVAVLGVGAGYLHACRSAGLRPASQYALDGVRTLISTGSPLSEQGFRWVYADVGPQVWLTSTSGGTEVCSAFVGGVPLEPVRAGRIQGPCLGVDAQAWDSAGAQLLRAPGELVITRPMPSMPLHLWDDPGGERYRASYFATYPGVWRHGDVIEFDRDGSCVIHGRSDATLNRKGVRIGSGEIYSVVEILPDVKESLVIGVEEGEGYYMPLFVVLAHGADIDTARERIAAAIREQLSPRHVPDEIIAMPGIPHTRTGKKLEVPIKRLLQGAPIDQVVDPGSVDDPALLSLFARFAEERKR